MTDYNDARAKALDAAAEQWCRLSPARSIDERMTRAIAAYEAHMAAAGWVQVPAALMQELADDLEAQIAAEYYGTSDYPSMERKRLRDMEPVERVRAMLAARPGAEVGDA